METGIHVGDYIISLKKKSYEEGDVVTYKFEDAYVTHRIVGIDDNKVITKGDANNTNDPSTVPFSNVVGKAELCLPKAGAVFRVVTAQENRVYVYIVIGILIGLTVMWIILDHIKKKKSKSNT